MLRIKSTPNHNYSVFVDLAENIDPKWMLGKIDENGKVIQKEIECELDGTQAIIELQDYFKETFERLTLLNFTLKLGYGIPSDEFKKMLIKKYKGKINSKREIVIILYKFIEAV